jgi:predicted secreted protein
MSIFGMIVTFIVVWWLVLFLVLPWGIQSRIKTDNAIIIPEIVNGADIGAPKTPNIKIKFLITTLIALTIWGFFAFIFYMDIVSVRSLL